MEGTCSTGCHYMLGPLQCLGERGAESPSSAEQQQKGPKQLSQPSFTSSCLCSLSALSHSLSLCSPSPLPTISLSLLYPSLFSVSLSLCVSLCSLSPSLSSVYLHLFLPLNSLQCISQEGNTHCKYFQSKQ